MPPEDRRNTGEAHERMWRQTAESLAVGLTVGPACFWHCGLFHGAVLARQAAGGRRHLVAVAVCLLGGRLLAYVLFGVLVGLLAESGIVMVKPWVLMAVLGLVMLVLAIRPAWATPNCPAGVGSRHALVGAFLFGLLTGLSPCPPFLAATSIALRSHGVAAAVATMLAFFVGSSVYLVPVWVAPALLPERLRAGLQWVSRGVAAAVAAYALCAAGRALAAPVSPADDRPPEQAAAGPGPARDAAPVTARPPAQPPAAPPPVAAPPETDGLVPPPAAVDVLPLVPRAKPTRRFTASLLQRLDLSLREALYYEPLANGHVQCHLCPSECDLENGEQGVCRARVNIDGRLRSMVYARPVSVHVDPIEKKPLFHVLPGSQAFSVATVGCNLGCVFCQNYEISQAAPEEVSTREVPPEQLVALCLKYGNRGIAYTYTEPTVFYEYMLETAKLARAKGLKNYWHSCGYIQEAPLLEMCKYLDAANVDLKGFSDEFYVRYCDAHIAPVLRTLEILRREQVHVEITNLVIPGANDDPEMIRAMCRWIVRRLGAGTPLHLSRFHPMYKLTKVPATPFEALTRARDIARQEGLSYVYIGNVAEPGVEDTVCPGCGRTVIRRSGYRVLANEVKDGRCAACGATIQGVWR